MSQDDYSESLERWPTPEDAGKRKFKPIRGPRRKFLERLFEECLTEQEREILVLYFGMDGEEISLQEVGERLGISGERTRQLRNRAFEKLRGVRGGEILEQFWRMEKD